MGLWSVGGRCPRCRHPLHVNSIVRLRGWDGRASTCGRLYLCFGCGWTRPIYRRVDRHGRGGHLKDGPRWTAPQGRYAPS